MEDLLFNLDMKAINRKNILKYIFFKKEVTRKELSDHTKLSNSSITRMVNELIDDGYILKKEKINKNHFGRKSEVLVVNRDKLCSFVIDIDVKKTMFGYGRFDGSVEILKTVNTPKSYKAFKETIRDFITQFKYSFDYISISVPGIVDSDNNKIISLPNLNWKDSHLEDLDGNEKVILENDSNLSLLAEKIFSDDMKGVSDAAYIIIKEGIGCGLLINNDVYRGKNFAAGEIGHNVYKSGSKSSYFETIFNFESNFEHSADLLALNISYLLNSLDLQKVIVGGKIMNMEPQKFDFLKNKIFEYTFETNAQNLDVRMSNFSLVPASMIGACVNSILRYIDDNV